MSSPRAPHLVTAIASEGATRQRGEGPTPAPRPAARRRGFATKSSPARREPLRGAGGDQVEAEASAFVLAAQLGCDGGEVLRDGAQAVEHGVGALVAACHQAVT